LTSIRVGIGVGGTPVVGGGGCRVSPGASDGAAVVGAAVVGGAMATVRDTFWRVTVNVSLLDMVNVAVSVESRTKVDVCAGESEAVPEEFISEVTVEVSRNFSVGVWSVVAEIVVEVRIIVSL